MLIIMAARTAEQSFGRRIAMGNFLRSKKSRRLPASLSRDALHTPLSLPRASTPSGVQGAQPPPGVQGSPPVSKNVGGWARWDNRRPPP